MDLKPLIRTIPDFPKKGIGFKDITTLLKDPEGFQAAIHQLCEPYRDQDLDVIVGIESRGFIFGSAMAVELGKSFVPVRKPGKLPAETCQESYSLEYGADAVEIHKDAIRPGVKVLIADDLLATGGTAQASVNLVEKLGGQVIGLAFLIELDFIKGRDKLKGYPLHILVHYSEE